MWTKGGWKLKLGFELFYYRPVDNCVIISKKAEKQFEIKQQNCSNSKN